MSERVCVRVFVCVSPTRPPRADGALRILRLMRTGGMMTGVGTAASGRISVLAAPVAEEWNIVAVVATRRG